VPREAVVAPISASERRLHAVAILRRKRAAPQFN
jgi:hypothetical protein